MKAFSKISGMALIAMLAIGASGCSSETAPSSESATLQNQAEAYSVVAASSEAELLFNKVDVKTTPAPPPPPMPAPITAPVSGSVSAPVQASAPMDDYTWLNTTMAKYGVYPDAGTQFVFGPMPAGCAWGQGCTVFTIDLNTGKPLSNYTITLLPGQQSDYLLFHEIAHARGIYNECAADHFMRTVLGPHVRGHYC